MMGIVVPEICWASNKIRNKYHLLHLVGILFPHINDDARSESLQIYKSHFNRFTSSRFFLTMAQRPPVGQGFLIIEASRSHSGTPHSVGLLWTSDQLVAETSTWQHTTLTTDRHPCPPAGFEPTIPASWRPQTHALDHAATGTGHEAITVLRKQQQTVSHLHVCTVCCAILLHAVIVTVPWRLQYLSSPLHNFSAFSFA